MIFAIKSFRSMERTLKILSLSVGMILAFAGISRAQNGEYDVFVPISKYISQGDGESLSAWFADNLDVNIGSGSSNCSKSQARQIVKGFFETNQPRSFTISHTAGKNNMKYAIGTLKTGGETFLVTIFVNMEGTGYKIQHLKIEPMP